VIRDKKSPARDLNYQRSRSRSNETKQFIDKIENLRKNLDVEGKALAGYYKKVETDKNTMITASDKQTKS
jgi:hypothetical protein